MRCTIFAVGLRGDVEPALALASGLRGAGLQVRCAVQEDFAAAAAAAGLEVAPVRGRAADFFGGAAGAAARDRLRTPLEFRRFFDSYLARPYAHMLDDLAVAARGADLVVCWPWMRVAVSIEDALKVPVVVAGVYPVMYLPTAAFPNPYQAAVPSPSSPSAVRRSWRLAIPAFSADHGVIQEWRASTLGLGRRGWRSDVRRLRQLPHLLGYSETVLPRPADWPRDVTVTGYWVGEEGSSYTPPADLARFLAAGPPPVVVGFSSQVGGDRASLTRAVVDGLSQAGARGVVLTGFGGLRAADAAPHVCVVEDVPHAWLFARASAVIHHGGSGTTGAALRAGLPAATVPFGYDQPLWAGRIHALGAGPAPLDHRTLDAAAIARAVETLTSDDGIRARAREIGERLRHENGVRAAVLRVLELLRL